MQALRQEHREILERHVEEDDILLTLESYRKFQFQRFNFLFVEAGHVQAHGRWKRTKRPWETTAVSEDAEAEIFITFKWKQYISDSAINLDFMPRIFSYDKAWSSKPSSCQLARANAQSDGKRREQKIQVYGRVRYTCIFLFETKGSATKMMV